MDIRKVKKLIELLEESNIDEIEIKEGEESVRISRNSAQAMTLAAQRPAYAAHRRSPATGSGSRARTGGRRPRRRSSGHVVNSPMVGTFYRSPSPTSPAFVEVGRPSRSAMSSASSRQ